MSTVFVTNNTEFELVDGCGGEFFDFKQGEAVEIPLHVAEHIFGYDKDDKMPYLARLGWVKSNADKKKGLELLAKVDIQLSKPVQNQSLSPLVEQVPLPPMKVAGGKVLKAV